MGVPIPRCGRAERENIPEEAREQVGDSVIVAAELKTEREERGEPIQLLGWIRQLLSQVPE